MYRISGPVDEPLTPVLDYLSRIDTLEQDRGLYDSVRFKPPSPWSNIDHPAADETTDITTDTIESRLSYELELLHVDAVEYALDRELYGPVCTIVLTVSAAADVAPDGTRKDDAIGEQGEIRINGRLNYSIEEAYQRISSRIDTDV